MLIAILTVFSAAVVLLPDVSPRPAAAFSCGPTPPNIAPAKLQIRVYGSRVDEVNWAFNVTPAPYTFSSSQRVQDNTAPDLSITKGDILLEGVCTSSFAGEIYTVTLAPDVITPCPLQQNTISQSAPAPTAPIGNPNTAAFYFTMVCPPPTPIPTPTPIYTPTPLPINVIVTVTYITGTSTSTTTSSTSVSTSSSEIACGGSALVTVRAFQGINPVPNGTPLTLTTSIGTLAQNSGTMAGGQFSTQLSLPRLSTASFGSVSATVSGAVTSAAAGSFTALPCTTETLSSPPQSPVGIAPPNTGDAGLR